MARHHAELGRHLRSKLEKPWKHGGPADSTDVPLRHRARNRALKGYIAREREALEAIAREQRQNRALRAGALFLLEPNTLHR